MKNQVVCTSALLVSSFGLLLTGCRSNSQPQMAPIVDGRAEASDPAAINLAPGTAQNASAPANAPSVTRVAASRFAEAPQSHVEAYPQQQQSPAEGTNYGVGNSQQNEAYRYNTQAPQDSSSSNDTAQQQYANAPSQADGQMTSTEYDQYADLLDPGVPAATQPPPPLPVNYEQPEAPGPDYLWTPGYWDYANTGYYYVPGSWVGAPYAGALWTPGWWGYGGSRYRWHHGYWGHHTGYYGGINYGFGYIGFGYQGGYWNGDHFFYNQAVNRVDPRTVNHNTYDRRVTVANATYINNTHVSYYGGPGGLRRAPTQQEYVPRRDERTPPMQAQIANRRSAEADRQQFYNANNGRPQILVAAHALQPDRNIVPPPRLQNGTQQVLSNGHVGPANGTFNSTANPQQRQQTDFQGRQRMEVQGPRQLAEQQHQQQQEQGKNAGQQQDVQRQQGGLQRQQQNEMDAQRTQAEQQQRTQMMEQRQQIKAQRQQLDAQRLRQQAQQRQQVNAEGRQAEQQQRLEQGQQRTEMQQQRTTQDQQRSQMMQQHQQMETQRQQLDAQHLQQQAQQRQQVNAEGRQAEQQQRLAQDQQRTQQQQQRKTQDQQRSQMMQQRQQMETQRQQLDAQRLQQQAQQRQQVNAEGRQAEQQQRLAQDQQRTQQQQQRTTQDQQRSQMMQQRQQMETQRQQLDTQRLQQQVQQRNEAASQREQRMQSHPAPTPHVDVPRAAPSMPRMDSPHVNSPSQADNPSSHHH